MPLGFSFIVRVCLVRFSLIHEALVPVSAYFQKYPLMKSRYKQSKRDKLKCKDAWMETKWFPYSRGE
ncbi:netrin g1 isoform 1 [Mobiluncus mulieris]|nr:hypothetical protein HMPREF0577_1619 [Mobiluncus mulieris ATCC 35243]MCU9970815.1 netrin g1 isoform 1 [Mobiluncus mulieris]MCV0002500.1 netrin g1 isoform 1 [Mobiluncus mulieris]NMW62674.1 netrin g1 isoform 1 [Mobiluncus mulieris]NMW90264.1 netrin g1 isoform 1 [Mobiluncus mulieris]